MAKQCAKTVTPRLRFPEFRRADGWTLEGLESVANVISNKVSVSSLTLDTYVSTENLLPDYGEMVQATKLPDVASVTRFEPSDVLISNIRPYLKKVWRSDRNGGASNDVIVVRAKEPIYDKFLSVVLRNDAFIAYVMGGAKGVKMPRGDIDAIRAYPFAYPARAEQQKIADCLTSLDEVIAAQGRKMEALKAHKRGLMQQLFPREGETRPRLRFPEFRDAPEWSEEAVDCLIDTITPPKKLPTADYAPQGRYPIVDQSPSPVCGWTDDTEAVITPSQPLIIFGDHTCVLKLQAHPFVQGADGIKILLPRQRVSSEFLYQSLQVRKIESTEYKRHYSELKEKRVCLPSRDSGEQDKVANLLGAIDTRIIAEVDHLGALKAHKQGLMQQLFPVSEGG